MSSLPSSAVEMLYPFLVLLVTFLGLVVAIAGATWAGFRWLRARIREEFGGVAFRDAVRAESIAALTDEAGQKAIDAAVARGISSVAEAQNKAISDLGGRLSDQGRRLGELEQRVSKLEGWFREELERIQRLLTKLYRALKRTGIIKVEPKTEETAG